MIQKFGVSKILLMFLKALFTRSAFENTVKILVLWNINLK